MSQPATQQSKGGRPPAPTTVARQLAAHLGIELPPDMEPRHQLMFAKLATETKRIYGNVTPSDLVILEKAVRAQATADYCHEQAERAKVEGSASAYLAFTNAIRQEMRVIQTALEGLGLTGSRRTNVARSKAKSAGLLATDATAPEEAEGVWASILN